MSARTCSKRIRRWLLAAAVFAAASPLGCARTPRDLISRVWGRADKSALASSVGGPESSTTGSTQGTRDVPENSDACADSQNQARFTLAQYEQVPGTSDAAGGQRTGRGAVFAALVKKAPLADTAPVAAASRASSAAADPFAPQPNASNSAPKPASAPPSATVAAPAHNPWEAPPPPNRDFEPELEDAVPARQAHQQATAVAQPDRSQPRVAPAAQAPPKNTNVFTTDLGSQLKKLRGESDSEVEDAAESDRAWEADTEPQAFAEVRDVQPPETDPLEPPQARGLEFAETYDLVPVKSQDLELRVRPADVHPDDLRVGVKKQVLRARQLSREGRLAEAYYLARSAAEEAERGGVVFLPDDDQPGPLEQQLRDTLNVAGWGGAAPRIQSAGEDASRFGKVVIAHAGSSSEQSSRANDNRVSLVPAPPKTESTAANEPVNASRKGDAGESDGSDEARRQPTGRRTASNPPRRLPVNTALAEEPRQDDPFAEAEPKPAVVRVSANQASAITAEHASVLCGSVGESDTPALASDPSKAAFGAVSGEASVASASIPPGDAPLVLPDSPLPDIDSEKSAGRFPWVLAIAGLTIVAACLGGAWRWRRARLAA